MTKSPSQRTSRRRLIATKTITTNMEPTTANSNMLPSGGRWTESPRIAAAAISRRAPNLVSIIAMPAALRDRSASSVGGGRAGASTEESAPTRAGSFRISDAAKRVGTAPARSTAKAIMAMVNTAMAE